ncbi:hypothetical protein AVEN_117908-1 [Araneus ventricosus]|uniref:RNase H type-1 domain-containing protein n=1 Tax=Araneus ventricosus TaxID=182803 RepID=A0A4Y2JCD8_ARAVE|nr:hypothetical protein AVEN_117908-1 [Araneus ventricosus]
MMGTNKLWLTEDQPTAHELMENLIAEEDGEPLSYLKGHMKLKQLFKINLILIEIQSNSHIALAVAPNKLQTYHLRNDDLMILAIILFKNRTRSWSSFCVLTNDIWAYQWSAKLNDNNTVFQAELTAFHEAVIYASHMPNHNTSKIHVDNRASIMASSNSKSTKETVRKIFKILLTNPRIKVSRVKAHAGNIAMREQTNWQKTQHNMGNPIHILSFLNRT